MKPSETRYAPVEGEALAIAWSLEQTRHFTQGCDELLVVTDHKPLVQLFSDRTLDEITNPRLFKLKQRTLMWRFTIQHSPGKLGPFSDATSRHPVNDALSCIRIVDDESDDIDSELFEIASNQTNNLQAITWQRVKEHSLSDPQIKDLAEVIQSGFPQQRSDLPPTVESFWKCRDDLHIIDDVVMMQHRIVIPEPLRNEVLQALHSAHQGESAMGERARQSVYWPGIDRSIERTRKGCLSCNKNAPSQPRLPPFEPHIPTTPFEAICADYFFYKGHYYFIAADRLSGWTEQSRVRPGTSESGANGLIASLRSFFSTFGVAVELTSDGGPEFSAKSTNDFLERWGVRHRVSSSYLPSSNGRAELAVKSTKRLLMDNVNENGDLNSDKVLRALLMKRNTPDPGCKLSPAEVLFGHPLRDSLPRIERHATIFVNPQISNHWRTAWKQKEEALKARYMKSVERLNEHSRMLQPLAVGDNVLIQNQTGSRPTKWDRSGKIVEVKDYDQYRIRLSGSGRTTLRNRKFIRKFEPHTLVGRQPTVPPPSIIVPAPVPIKTVTTPIVPADPELTVPDQPVVPTPAQPTILSSREEEVASKGEVRVETPPLRRSTRERRPTKFYDPQTGRYVDQNL